MPSSTSLPTHIEDWSCAYCRGEFTALHPKQGRRTDKPRINPRIPGDLWVGDVLHVRRPVVDNSGRERNGIPLPRIDSATRY